LESLSGIAKAKGHAKIFKESKRSNDGGFWNVGVKHGNLVVSFRKIKRRKDVGIRKALENIVDQRHRIRVMDRDLVEATVVSARSIRAVLFRDEM
jgi:hypothetical protein